MKFLSIKLKITLWYALFTIGLVISILGILIKFTDITLLSTQKKELVEVVEDVREDILEGDNFSFFDDGIFILLYDLNKNYIDGSPPPNFSINYPLENNKIQKLEIDGENFYIYDKEVFYNGKIIWIRGVFSDIHSKELTTVIIKSAFIILPLLVIISLVIGYIITKNALLPVKKIQETAENITNNNTLSLRINLPYGNDEIAKLGATIDKMLDKLEKSFNKEKQFTSDVSHELRTPISVILAESEYILSHCNDIEEAKTSMEVINRQGEKISTLINQLLFFAREEQDKIKLNLEYEDVSILLSRIISDNKFQLESKNITTNYTDNLTTKEFRVDKIMFIRAIQNILQNSINYGKENGVINIISFENSNYFAVQIEDNGIGIAKENIEKIWDRFYQVDSSRSSSNMGLGLSIVKLIIEKHNGYIEVESKLGKGTKFILYFKKNF